MSALFEYPDHPLAAGNPPTWATLWGQDRYGVFAGFHVGDVAARMRWIPAGAFTMGSPDTDTEAFEDEKPQHGVTLNEGFWLGEFPCTQAMWTAVMEDNPSRFQNLERPVEKVSWDDVQTFFRRIEERLPGLGLRLPSEAQWEYACRAGTESARYGELDEIAWYDQNSGGETHVVGEKRANAWGLYDTLGNVWEWCQDEWSLYEAVAAVDLIRLGVDLGAHRVGRGGSWILGARYARAAFRYRDDPSYAWGYQGFRFSRGQGP